MKRSVYLVMFVMLSGLVMGKDASKPVAEATNKAVKINIPNALPTTIKTSCTRQRKPSDQPKSKPATMEGEAMRRAKVFHRGLPIEGCAPLSPEAHYRRFHAAKQAEKKQSSATDTKQK
jgi:hypothetical protein